MLHGIVTSDWHLEGLSNIFPNDGVERQLAVIDRIYQYAVDMGIKHIFIPGDITDTDSMSVDTQRKLIKFFAKYDGLICSYYIGGNHDYHDINTTSVDLMGDLCAMDLYDSVEFHTKPKQKVIDGVTVNFIPFPATERPKSKRPALNFVHCDYNGAVGDNGRPLKATHEVATRAGDFTFSGHIHKRQFLKKRRIAYCGNPYQKNFGENDPKGFIEFQAEYVKGKLDVTFRDVELKQDFRFVTKKIEKQADFDTIKHNDGCLYRLYLSDDVVMPATLRNDCPNVLQVYNGSKLQKAEATLLVQQYDAQLVDPTKGLARAMKDLGHSKSDYLLAKQVVKDAMSSLCQSVTRV